jgi:Domain of unknown function (DUF4268)
VNTIIFDKSAKRLDLLALDRDGKLVIIELKRDAAKSLADLQAIRYAAFCSTLTFENIVNLYSQFAHLNAEHARQGIQKFLGKPDFELDNKPRIILAAGGFDDQELTSCVLWLRNFGVDISCVEITPYRMVGDDRIILVPKIIIPLPEAETYIVLAEKKEAAVSSSLLAQQYRARNQEILTYFHDLAPSIGPQSAWAGHYMQVSTGHAGVHFEWLFRGPRQSKLLEVGIHFETSSKEQNQKLCNLLMENKTVIETTLGEAIKSKLEFGSEWSSLFLERSCEPCNDEVALWGAKKIDALIKIVQPLLDQFFKHEAIAAEA